MSCHVPTSSDQCGKYKGNRFFVSKHWPSPGDTIHLNVLLYFAQQNYNHHIALFTSFSSNTILGIDTLFTQCSKMYPIIKTININNSTVVRIQMFSSVRVLQLPTISKPSTAVNIRVVHINILCSHKHTTHYIIVYNLN